MGENNLTRIVNNLAPAGTPQSRLLMETPYNAHTI